MGLVAVAVELLVAWQWPGGACLEEEEEVEEELEEEEKNENEDEEHKEISEARLA